MLSKILRFKKTSHAIVVFAAIAAQLSCSKYNANSTGGANSGLTFRAFVSNPVQPSAAGGGTPVLNIMDATKDLLSQSVVSLLTVSANVSDAGMMSLSPNHDRTLVMSPTDSKLALVDNTKEAIVGAITLPGPSESFFVANDNSTVFVAIPSASVSGQPQGVVEEISTAGAAAKIPIPGAHYIVPSPNGNQILVFSDNADTVVLLTPGLIGAAGQPTSISPCTTTQVPACTLAPTFDRPVGAIFDPSGSTAYVINCGAECGGTTAGIAAIDMTNTGNAGSVLLATLPVIAASTALLQGSELYVAGTPVGAAVGSLSVLNLTGGISTVHCISATPANCNVFQIADGHHTQMQMGANGQLFIGSKGCSNVCLSIFDTTKSTVAAPKNSPAGDVTGIAPIPKRNVVYVCQGALLRVYDTTTDQLANLQPDGQPNIIGQAIDVKVIDF